MIFKIEILTCVSKTKDKMTITILQIIKKQRWVWILIPLIVSCKNSLIQQQENTRQTKANISQTLNHWHQAATDADFKTYFSLMNDDAVFVGTDSSEVWTKKAFMSFAKPYFDKGEAWAFKPIKRHIYLDKSHKNIAWFDETLETWMGVCRGSGVLEKSQGKWRIKHYVLSVTVPNEKMKDFLKFIVRGK